LAPQAGFRQPIGILTPPPEATWLALEYEDVLLRPELGISLQRDAIEGLLDYYCAVARHHEIFFLWRPCLQDPGDDMVLELAVKAGCRAIITYNQRDFAGCEHFGVSTLTPAEFLDRIGEKK
jgi:predicted nucleic acid-binding protein